MKSIIISSLVLIIGSFQLFCQESGWVEKDGFKQQLYKTGEIKQLLYSPTGDTIITVTKDSVWHRYLWEAKSGKLLKVSNLTQLFSKQLYNVFFSADQTTYSVVIRNNDSLKIKLLYSNNDNSFFDTVMKVRDFDSCQVFYHNNSKIMWIMINTFILDGNMMSISATSDGKLSKYSLSDKRSSLLAEYGGKSLFLELANNYRTLLRTKVYKKFEKSKNDIFTNIYDINVESISDTLLSASSNQSKNQYDYNPNRLNIQSRIFLYNQENIFSIIVDKSSSNFIKDFKTLLNKNDLPFFPYLVKEAVSHNHVLMIHNKNMVLYNYSNNTYSTTEQLPSLVNDIVFHENNLTISLACTDGFIRIKKLNLYDSTISSTFKVSHRLRYVKNKLLFTSLTKKPVLSYHWDFGDGTVSTLQHPIHAYSRPDTFTVRLSVKYIDGKSDSIVQDNIVIIYPILNSNFSISQRWGTPPFNVDFHDKSSGYINKWIWDFGDGSTSNIPNPTHSYSKPGYYQVSLEIFDSLSSSLFIYPEIIVSNEYHIDSLNIYAIKYKKAYFSTEKDEKISTSYKKGFFDSVDNNLILFFQDENRIYKYMNGQTYDRYTITQGLINWRNDNFYNRYTIYEYNNSNLLRKDGIPYHIYKERKGNYITSFEAYTDYKYPYLQAIVNTNKFAFAPSGWSHDFNGVFLPDGTDIFLFRNKQSSLQFFYNDTTAFHRLDFSAQFSDIFAMLDSLSCLLFTNPAFDLSDSTNNFTLNTLDNKGNLLREVKIPKTINAAITCLRPLDHDSFFIAGYTGTRNEKGQIIDKKGYIALININGFVEWQNTIPTYSDIRTIQKHPNNYFAALGLPYTNQKHGFIAFREKGKILADFRLFDAHSSFYPNDFIIGNKEHDIWFIGEEHIENQGKRATVYSCNNPVTPTTDIDSSQQDLSPTTQDFSVSPNPASDIIYLHNHSGMVTLYDLMGNIILHSDSSTLDCSQLIQGIYVIKSEKRHIKPIMIIIQK